MKERLGILKWIVGCLLGALLCAPESLLSQDSTSGKAPTTNLVAPALPAGSPDTKPKKEIDKEIVKALEAKKAQTHEALKSKQEDIEKARQEADKAIQEKLLLEKQTPLTQKEIQVKRGEIRTLEKELALSPNLEIKKRLKALREEASKAEQQLQVNQKKLSTAEANVELAQGRISYNQQAIEDLQKELGDLKREKAARRGWVDKSIDSALIFLVGIVLWKIKKYAIRKFEGAITDKDAIRESEVVLRLKTMTAIFQWLLSIIIIGIVAYMILEEFGLNMTPLLAGVGIVGLAFGFGGQYLIRDIINGIFILIENQYNINDVIKIGDIGGLVEGVNLRYTRLRDVEGRVIYIPNGEIKVVINFTKEFSQAVLDIGVAYKENVDKVMDVMRQVGAEMRQDDYFRKIILEDLEMLGVDALADSQVTIRCRIKTKPIKQWEVAREFRRRIKNRFDELGIEIPFPHRTLYTGTGPENDWLKKLAQERG